MPAGTRTIPPNAPTWPTESAVRVPATSRPIRSLARLGAGEVDPPRVGVLPPRHRHRLRQLHVGEIPERADPALDVVERDRSKPRMPNCSTAYDPIAAP